MASVWAELRRRNVVKVAVAYAIVAWLLIEVVSTTFPMLRLPEWAATLVTVLLVIGFPVALIFAWAYELTPGGLKRDTGISAEERLTATQVATEQSVAVLPFLDMSPNKDQEYFSDGITEELLNQLTKLRGLHVAGRTSSFYFKGKSEDLRIIGEKLNVAYVLEGSVRKAGDRVRITAQLVKASDGYHLWSETFDRDLDDIFAIQDETAKAVADALSVTLGVGDIELKAGGTRNFAAYDAYLAGLALSQQEGRTNTEHALEKFEKAVKMDPVFADAWSQLALNCVFLSQNYMPENAAELNERADEAAQRAAAAAPEAISSLVAMAFYHAQHRTWLEAEKLFKRALELAPADPEVNTRYGIFLGFVGRMDEARACMERAVRAEPLSMIPARYLVNFTEFSGDLGGALAQYRKAKELPGDHFFMDVTAAVIGMRMGDHALVRENLGKHLDSMFGTHKVLTAKMLELMEAPLQALAELHRMYADPVFKKEGSHVPIAVWASFLGDDELALDVYRGMLSSPFTSFLIIWRPLHERMRQLPGFKDLLRDLGLVDYWRSTKNWGDFCQPIDDHEFKCK